MVRRHGKEGCQDVEEEFEVYLQVGMAVAAAIAQGAVATDRAADTWAE